MLDTILKLDPEQITQWVAVLIALVTLIKSAREKDRSDKWAYIKAIVPEAHNLAQKIATATRHTKKDDEFVA
jgi:site-specific recombinase